MNSIINSINSAQIWGRRGDRFREAVASPATTGFYGSEIPQRIVEIIKSVSLYTHISLLILERNVIYFHNENFLF